MGEDILSQIVNHSKPELLSSINPKSELDLIPYYHTPVGTQSFIGIPIIYDGQVAGILCADSDMNDAYDGATAIFLGQFTKILSVMFGSFSDNYSKENANKTIGLLNSFSQMVSEKGCSFNDICSAIIDFIVSLYDCSAIGVCSYNDTTQNWMVSSYKSVEKVDDQYFKSNISLSSSLVGISISQCNIFNISNIDKEYTRVNSFEPVLANGAFVSIPIKSTTDTYGALFIESQSSSFSTEIEMDILTAICNQAGEMLEKINMVTLFEKYVSFETRTGIFTENSFRERVNEEFVRASDTNTSISLALIALDKYSSLEEANKKNQILDYVINVILKHIKPFEIIGRVNSDVLGIILINRDSNQSKLLLERIRQQIATQFINVGNEKLVVTLSAGIATNLHNDTFDTFTSNATIALRHAQKRSNSVYFFE
jgi:diguanylate cyclase (GGDEF)-like protein